MPNVFKYTNFRTFLLDYYYDKKKLSPSFSYNSFSLKAGFKNKGFLYSVIHGNKNLSKSSIIKISRAIGFKSNEAEYFENLVFFNQAIDLLERAYFCEKLKTVKSTDRAIAEVQKTRKDQYAFYSTWYHSAVRSLIDMYPFRDDYAWLAGNLYPPITVKQAKRSVKLLEKLGLIEQQKDGIYRVCGRDITTGDEFTSLAVLDFHKEASGLVKHSLDTVPRDRRNITGLTLGISERTYHRICDEIKAFRIKIVNLAHRDHEADRAYQLNFHLFPITNTEIKDPRSNT